MEWTKRVSTSPSVTRRAFPAAFGPGCTTLKLANWLEQQTASEKVKILKYGAKQVFEPPKRGFERGALRGTPRADAVVQSTPRPACHRPMCRRQHSTLQTPIVPLKITKRKRFRTDWGPFEVPRQRRGLMGCALGHRSSAVRRIGTIYGGPDTSHELSFEPCHQQGHQMKLK